MPLDHNASLRTTDPAIAALIDAELHRQQNGLELIASENFASRAVIDAMGTPLTNKYAEGYPRQALLRRLRGGWTRWSSWPSTGPSNCFGADHANVQPHSGAQANFAAFMAIAKPGETIMGLALPHGGHLSHGSAVNHSGAVWHAVQYGVDPATGRIDYDQVAGDGAEGAAPDPDRRRAAPTPRIIDFAAFRSIADEVGGYLLVDMAHFAGLVAGGVHPSPVPHAQIVTSTTHKTLRGPRAGIILSIQELAAAINKSVFPGTQGGPLEHVIASKAVAFGEAYAGFQDLRQAGGRKREDACRGDDRVWLRDCLGGDRHPPHAGGSASQVAHWQGSGGAAGQGRDHGQQEHHPGRSAVALRDQRHQTGDACHDHPRNGQGRIPPDRQAH